MAIVPFDPRSQPAVKPPDSQWMMMAAAQMHKEGRLVEPGSERKLPANIKDQINEQMEELKGNITVPPGFVSPEEQKLRFGPVPETIPAMIGKVT